MTLVRNSYSHPYSPTAGPTMAPQEVADVDLSFAQEQDAIVTGGLIVMDPNYVPPDSPTPDPVAADPWRPSVPSVADLPATGNANGDIRQALEERSLWTWDATASEWVPMTGGGAGSQVYVWDADSGTYVLDNTVRDFRGPVDPTTIPEVSPLKFAEVWSPTEEPG